MKMQTNRIRFNIIIGYDAPPNRSFIFESSVQKALCRLYGGMTVYNGQGLWLESASESRESYSGKLESEKAFTMILSVESDKAEKAYNDIQRIISDKIKLYKMPAEWIHCEAESVKALHFQASKVTATAKKESVYA